MGISNTVQNLKLIKPRVDEIAGNWANPLSLGIKCGSEIVW